MNRQCNGKKSLKIREGKSKEIYRIRRYNTMATIKKGQKDNDLQNATQKTKD